MDPFGSTILRMISPLCRLLVEAVSQIIIVCQEKKKHLMILLWISILWSCWQSFSLYHPCHIYVKLSSSVHWWRTSWIFAEVSTIFFLVSSLLEKASVILTSVIIFLSDIFSKPILIQLPCVLRFAFKSRASYNCLDHHPFNTNSRQLCIISLPFLCTSGDNQILGSLKIYLLTLVLVFSQWLYHYVCIAWCFKRKRESIAGILIFHPMFTYTEHSGPPPPPPGPWGLAVIQI